MWCIGRIDSRFLAQMERILWLYSLPYDPLYPVICYDERPCFLIGDRVEPLALQTGQLRREHYAYEKLGSAALLAALEPLTGRPSATTNQARICLVLSSFGSGLSRCYQDQAGPRQLEHPRCQCFL